MSSIPQTTNNTDRKVKLYLNGTPVSNSLAQSVYARYLNIVNPDVTASVNNALGTYDLSIPVVTAGSGVTVTKSGGNYNIGLSPTTSTLKTGQLLGGCAGINGGSGGKTIGSGIMAGWMAYNNLEAGAADSDGSYLKFKTGTSSGNFAEYSTNIGSTSGQAGYPYVVDFNPSFTMKMKFPSISNISLFFGFTGNTPLATGTSSYLSDRSGYAIRYDSGVDSKFTVLYAQDGGTGHGTVDTGVTVSSNTVYTLNVFGDFANLRWGASVNGGTPIYQPTSSVVGSQHTESFNIRVTTLSANEADMNMYSFVGQIDK